MGSLSVVVVPVGLMPVEDTQLRVVAYRPRSGWMEARAETEDVLSVARKLIASTPGVREEPMPELEAVGFVTRPEGARLVYTAPLPLSALLETDAQPNDPEWTLLAPWGGGGSTEGLELVQAMVLDHWRHAVAETTAAFDLLPNYFTTSQVRALYSSLWGQARDWSNFHRWLHKNNEGICRGAPPEIVEADVEQALEEALQSVAAAATAGTTAKKLWGAIEAATSAGLVGMSPVALGSLARVLPPVAAAAALAGGAIAYQRSVARGKAPAWFTRSDPARRVLKEMYSPRPEWLRPDQTARRLR